MCSGRSTSSRLTPLPWAVTSRRKLPLPGARCPRPQVRKPARKAGERASPPGLGDGALSSSALSLSQSQWDKLMDEGITPGTWKPQSLRSLSPTVMHPRVRPVDVGGSVLPTGEQGSCS